MLKTINRRNVLIVVITKVLIVLLWHPSNGFGQSGVDLDYFDVRFRKELAQIEAYHFTSSTFWRHYKAGDWRNALNELRFILRYFPNHPTALLLMGSISKLQKSSSLVIPYYQRAIALYPQYAATYAQYGAYLADMEFINEAIAMLEQAIKIDPNSVQAYKWLAKAYDKIGKSELSRKTAERAKELELSRKLPGRTSEHDEKKRIIPQDAKGEQP